ncbi:MAG: NUDIX hydrolase [Syntrophaceae bacterium]|nr:NUDIX hydrolase [Syntrophaceae bacterium]
MKEVIYHGKVFDLYREEITLPNGREMMAEFIHHPGSSGVIPLIDKDSVVLVRQYRPILKKFIWEIPSGTMLLGEDPLTCARRELEEECGLLGKRFEKLGEILVAPWYSDERTHLFIAMDLTPCEQKLDEDEVLTTHTLSWDQTLKMIERGEIQDATAILGLQLAYSIVKRN